MKTAILLAALLAASAASADQYVRPHVRADGTFVEGHMRSSPNSTTYDNYSTRGNSNPYTGERGSQNPYGNYDTQRSPSYGTPSSQTMPSVDTGSRRSRSGW